MSNKFQIFIDIADAEWRIAQFKRDGGKAVLKRCDIVAISGRSPQEIERDLKSVLAASAHRSDVVLSLPRKKVLLKHMRLPSSDPKEIAKMVGLQLVGQIPYSLQDVVHDYVILRTEGDGYTRIQVVVVLVSVIDEYLKLIKPFAPSVSRMSVSSYGISAWLAMLAKKRAWPLEKTMLVLNVDRDHSEACFCQGSKLLFSRFIPSGRDDLSRKETSAFFQQLQWSLDLYRKEHPASELNHVLIVGALEDSEFLKGVLQDKFKIPVDVAHPFDVLDDKDRKMFDPMRLGDGRSWVVSLGIMVNPSVQSLNLSPGHLRKDRASQKQLKQRIMVLALTGVVVFLMGLGIVMETSLRQMRLKTLQTQIGQAQPKADRLKVVVNQTRALDDYFRKRIWVSELMKELYKRTPEDVIYQSVYWTEERELILQGYAQTRSGVNNLQSGLIDSSWFQDVQLDYATKRKLGNVDVTDFRIHGRIADKPRGSL